MLFPKRRCKASDLLKKSGEARRDEAEGFLSDAEDSGVTGLEFGPCKYQIESLEPAEQ